MYNRSQSHFQKNEKGECIFILSKRIKHYTKEMLKLTNVMVIAMLIISAIIFIKYKPVYQVIASEEVIGYVESKTQFEQLIEDVIINKKDENIAFVTLDEKPQYELKFVNSSIETNEQDVLNKIEDISKTTYITYAITLNGENKEYVASIEESESLVEEIKQEYEDEIDFEIGMMKVYTEDFQELQTSTVEVAKEEINEELEELIKIEESTVNGVLLAQVPVTGIISSRYGETSGRSGGHCGLDIAAPSGTPIYACGDGTVIQAGWYGGYGNLVIIDHGNGVHTYYGHCSKLYVTKGEEVTSGQNIAAVGSTGDSTGPHLHLEIRINGSRINPQQYFYK